MARILVLGGYGNAGSQIVDMMLQLTDHDVVVAGRDHEQAEGFVAERPASAGRLSAAAVDATSAHQLLAALVGVDLCIVSSATGPTAGLTADACLAVGCHYLDIQLGRQKLADLGARGQQAQLAGICLVTDAGFHPGLPAAMVRHVLARRPQLTGARVASVIAGDWAALRPLAESTVGEMLEEFRDFAMEEYSAGEWRTARRTWRVRFPEPFGVRRTSPMGLAEMHELVARAPNLQETGFYVGGFNPVTDNVAIPLVWLGMKMAPRRGRRPLGRFLYWSLRRYSRPPFGTILQLDGRVARQTGARTLMRVSHADAYTLTAAPAVGTALQVLDGGIRSGLHLAAMAVDTDRLFADLVRLGVRVELFR